LALIAVLVAFMAIVTGSGGGGGATTNESATTTSAHTNTSKTKTRSSKAAKKKSASDTSSKTYTVQAGDTLGAIAGKTGVPLSRIEELNPDVDPHAMTTGQEIRLK
jgi:LysM repeat protein